jgi:hypothetical protein
MAKGTLTSDKLTLNLDVNANEAQKAIHDLEKTNRDLQQSNREVRKGMTVPEQPQPVPETPEAVAPQPSPSQGLWQRLRNRFRKLDNPKS